MKRYQKLLEFILVFGLFLGTLIAFNQIGEETIRNYVQSLGVYGPLLFILVHTLSIIIAPFEGSFLMLAANGIFGNFWFAVGIVMIGGFCGASINFWIARRYGKSLIRSLVGENLSTELDKYSEIINKRPILLYPLMATSLFDLVGYAAGLTSVSYKNFILAVTFSSIINVPIYVAIGSSILSKDFGIALILTAVVFIGTLYIIKSQIQIYIHKSIEKNKSSPNLE